MAAPDIRSSAYMAPDIDDAIVSATRAVDKLCHRGAPDAGIPGFLPWTGTIRYDWPNDSDAKPGRLWLEEHSLLSVASFTSGGSTIPNGSILLEPAYGGPPYNRIEINRSTADYFQVGTGTGQQSIAINGVWLPHQLTELAPSSFTLSGSPDASTTTIATNGPAYVGDILRVDSERMLVQDKGWTSSGQIGSLAGDFNVQSFTVADASGFRTGEELLIDAERVLVLDIAGTTLIVKRAWNGSTLASHTGATIYWPRSLTVKRGVLGTTAASHTSGAQIYRNLVTPLVRKLTIAYALDTLFQENTAYARTVGSGDATRNASGRGIHDLEERVRFAHGRIRIGAV